MNKTQKYRKTAKGVLTNIYSNQRRQLLRLDHPEKKDRHTIHYSLKELHNKFLNNKKFIKLYENWVISGYKPHLKPSIDRIDPYKNYILNNIQIVTWEENRRKGHIEIGIKSRKKVIMCDMDGKKISIFNSLTEAKEKMNLKGNHISAVCRGKLKSYKGYKWKYI